MIRKIEFIKYKKFEDVSIEFGSDVTVIAGTNGTCKTSLLHIISNSFQYVDGKDPRLKDKECMSRINQSNYMVNAKLERLNKGAKHCPDPAPGRKSTLYRVGYLDETELDFRRHNSKAEHRYSMKPPHNKKGQNLPKIPVIYLGIKRLFPLGEYPDKSPIKTLRKDIPGDYLDEMKNEYSRLTGIDMIKIKPQSLGEVKIRSDFETVVEGVDSNTISVGEDNLYIIMHSLYSLKYYYDSIEHNREVESILLIDELDASLHPYLQMELIDRFIEFSKMYKIQIIFTTHSLTAIEHAIRKQLKVNYLMDNGPNVSIEDGTDICSIEMFLENKRREEIFRNRRILVWMEDDEAREFFKMILQNRPNEAFAYFDTVDIKVGADQLKAIFKDDKIHGNMTGCICILDGDMSRKADPNYRITVLPGEHGPDRLALDYGSYLYDNNVKTFWDRKELKDEGLTYTYYRSNIRDSVKDIIDADYDREKVKKHYSNHKQFYNVVLRQWVIDHSNGEGSLVWEFYRNLEILYQKCCMPLLLPRDKWHFQE